MKWVVSTAEQGRRGRPPGVGNTLQNLYPQLSPHAVGLKKSVNGRQLRHKTFVFKLCTHPPPPVSGQNSSVHISKPKINKACI